MLLEFFQRVLDKLSAETLTGEIGMNTDLFQFNYCIFPEAILRTPQNIATKYAID